MYSSWEIPNIAVCYLKDETINMYTKFCPVKVTYTYVPPTSYKLLQTLSAKAFTIYVFHEISP